MLHENTDYGGDSSKTMERCRPDYEAIIKRAKEKLHQVVALKSALFDYLGNRRVKKELAEMIGELVMEERELTVAIDNAIREQEAAA